MLVLIFLPYQQLTQIMKVVTSDSLGLEFVIPNAAEELGLRAPWCFIVGILGHHLDELPVGLRTQNVTWLIQVLAQDVQLLGDHLRVGD